MNAIISVANLSKTYASGLRALSNINLDIRRGEIFGLLGPNGAGKTTLIGIICGIVNPSEGKIRVDGHDIVRDYRAVRSMIGLVPQELTTDAFETVWNTVSFSRGLFGKAANPAHIEKVLKDLSLWNRKDSKVMTLSGGMKRRLLIAKALSHEPRILFLDEPTSGVDPISRRNFWELIYSLAEGGTTALVSTHYMEEAEYCHRLALMNRGRLIALDSPQSLRRLMTEPLLEVTTRDGPAVAQALQGAPGVLDAAMFGRAVHVVVENARDAAARLPALLAARGLSAGQIAPITPSLEDVFVALVRREGGAVVS